MKCSHLSGAFAAIAALTLVSVLSGCEQAGIPGNSFEGKPLSELDVTGQPPRALALYGPDVVNIRDGAALAITVEGDSNAADQLRFSLKNGTLGIGRTTGTQSSEKAVVNVVMPPPRKITAAGSGRARAETLAKDAEITVAGSGDVEAKNVAADGLKVTIAGSGAFRTGGTATDLVLNIAGSGNADMKTLTVGNASIKIAGSGRSSFASDGQVRADIIGSGDVKVTGRATCKVNSTGTGRLVCEPGDAA